MSARHLLYLPEADWSPRFDGDTFFSVSLAGARRVADPAEAPPPAPPAVRGRMPLPAYYYELVVRRGRATVRLWRRYSQFRWLFQELRAQPPEDPAATGTTAATTTPQSSVPALPAGTCFYQRQDDAFAADRCGLLRDWLQDVLARPGAAAHPAVRAFLELADTIA